MREAWIFCLLVAGVVAQGTKPTRNNAKEDPLPCNIGSDLNGDYGANCSNESLVTLNDVSHRLPGNISWLDVSNNSLSAIDLNVTFVNLTKIVASKNKIDILSNIINVPNLKSLDLSSNKLKKIEDASLTATKLESLVLKSNEITVPLTEFLPTDLPKTLIKLVVENNSLSSLDMAGNDLPNFHYLYAGNNYIKEIKSLGKVPKLHILDVQHNKITRLDSNLFNNTLSLHSVNLANNLVENISNVLGPFMQENAPEKHTSLDLRSNRISLITQEQLETCMNSHPNMQLYLSDNTWKCDCKLKWFVWWLLDDAKKERRQVIDQVRSHNYKCKKNDSNYDLYEYRCMTCPVANNNADCSKLMLEHPSMLPNKNLTIVVSLDVSFNDFTDFDFNFMLPNLENLTAVHSHVEYITNVTGLPNLETLDLSDNLIRNIPSLLSQLTKLRSLDLSNNLINSPTSNVENGLPANLEFLNLHGNSLSVLHENSFKDLSQLKTLNLSQTNLAAIKPGTLSLFSKTLIVVDLSNNEDLAQVESYLEVFEQFYALEKLYMRNTGLMKLDNLSTVFSHANLNSLDFSHNQIHVIHEDSWWLKQKETLTSVNLANNPFACSCEIVWLGQWLKHLNESDPDKVVNSTVPNAYNCHLPSGSHENILHYQPTFCDHYKEASHVVAAVVIVLLLIVISLGILAFCYIRKKRRQSSGIAYSQGI